MTKNLGEQLTAYILAGKNEQANRKKRWAVCRGFYYNEPVDEGYEPYSGAYNSNYNLIQQKGDVLASSVVGTITSETPYASARCIEEAEGDNVAAIENYVQFHLESGKFKKALRSAAIVAYWSNRAWIKIGVDEKRRRFTFSVVEPFAQVVYPAFASSLQEAKLVGDVFYRRRSEIEKMQKDGIYDNVSISSVEERGDGPTGKRLSASEQPDGERVSDQDDMIELWDVIYRGEDEKLFRATVCPRAQTVLKNEEWEGMPHPYAEFSFKPIPVSDGYYPANSVANDLQDSQISANELMNLSMNGMRFNAYGAWGVQGNVESATNAVKYQPGQLLKVNMNQAVNLTPGANIGEAVALLPIVVNHADEVARISQVGAASAPLNNQTATATSAMVAGQRQAIDEYVDSFGEGVIQAIEFVAAVLRKKYKARDMAWFTPYAKIAGVEKEEDLGAFNKEMLWILSADSVGTTPAAQMSTSLQLLNIALSDQNGRTGLDAYKLATNILDLAERMGLPDARSIQESEDPALLVEKVAEAFGLEPVVVSQTLEQLNEQAMADELALNQSMGGVPEPSMPQGDAGGVPGLDGVPSARPGDLQQSGFGGVAV